MRLAFKCSKCGSDAAVLAQQAAMLVVLTAFIAYTVRETLRDNLLDDGRPRSSLMIRVRVHTSASRNRINAAGTGLPARLPLNAHQLCIANSLTFFPMPGAAMPPWHRNL